MNKLSPVVKYLLFVNILFFVLKFAYSYFYPSNDLGRILGLFFFQSPNFNPYQIVTHIFMHANFFHLLFNMFALVSFGSMVEESLGSKRFFIYYFICGMGAVLLHTSVQYFEFGNMMGDYAAFTSHPTYDAFANFSDTYYAGSRQDPAIQNLMTNWYKFPNDVQLIAQAKSFVKDIYEIKINVPTVGASGAIFGVLMAFGYLFPDVKLFLMLIPVPIKAKYAVWLYAGMELMLGINNSPTDNVAHFAHLGGLLIGLILLKIWKVKPNFR